MQTGLSERGYQARGTVELRRGRFWAVNFIRRLGMQMCHAEFEGYLGRKTGDHHNICLFKEGRHEKDRRSTVTSLLTCRYLGSIDYLDGATLIALSKSLYAPRSEYCAIFSTMFLPLPFRFQPIGRGSKRTSVPRCSGIKGFHTSVSLRARDLAIQRYTLLSCLSPPGRRICSYSRQQRRTSRS